MMCFLSRRSTATRDVPPERRSSRLSDRWWSWCGERPDDRRGHLWELPFRQEEIALVNTTQPFLYIYIFTCQINNRLIESSLLFRFSVSNDLKYDAERDLRDIGAKNIQVHALNKVRYFVTVRSVHDVDVCLISSLFYSQFKYGKISSKHNGSVKKGVIFATYSSLIGESQSGGKYKTRFQQLLHWCGEDFDGVVSF